MALKPWYKVITPREDLRDGRPLDASEFAVHLDHVRDGRAPDDYKKPERFFDRTFLTSSLRELGGGVIRRLSGIKVETSAIYNLTTQFGGGKTHALTLLYHLAQAGPAASNWKGVPSLLDQAGMGRQQRSPLRLGSRARERLNVLLRASRPSASRQSMCSRSPSPRASAPPADLSTRKRC